MKWFGFFLNVLGLFISSTVLAMDAPITKIEPGDTPSLFQEPGESVFHERLDRAISTISDSQAFLEGRNEVHDLSLERFSFTKQDISDSQTPFKQSSKFSDLSLERVSFATPCISDSQSFYEQALNFSDLSLEKFSFATPNLELGFSFGSPPYGHSPLNSHFLSFLPKPPKPVTRQGFTLPKVDLGHLGISDFFNERGIPLGKYDVSWHRSTKKFELETFKIQPLLNDEFKPFEISSLLSRVTTTEGSEVEPFKIPSLLDSFMSTEEKAYQKTISDLTDEEIIILFKHLTSDPLHYVSSGEETTRKLEELLQDERAQKVILETAKGSEDIISTALEATTGFLGNSRKLKTLISSNGFLEHLLNQPADAKGETVVSKAFLNAIFTSRPEALAVFFENQRICKHLSSIPDEKYQSVVMHGLIAAVLLPCGDTVLPVFYKSRDIFEHLVSCFSQGDLEAQVTSKIYTKVGLLKSLSEHAEKEINDLLHEGVMSFIREDADFLIHVMKKAIEDRNPYLARKLLRDLEPVISPAQIKEALQVSTIWEILSDENKRTLLAKAQEMDLNLTEEGLLRHHKKMNAYEHALMGHPLVVNDMETLAFEGHEKYKNLLTEIANPLEREAQKKALEREFLKAFPAKTAPWFHAEAEAAYDLRMFGQGVNGLVVELDVLPEHQRKGLLHPHLSEETVYKEEKIESRSAHNIGVTSLVAQMAPMATITSTDTSHLKAIGTHMMAGKYPFINCSWGPLSEIKDTDNPFSIFSSHKELNSLLGRLDVVLIKSAGNEGASLSDSESTEDIAGKVFSILLSRLEPNQLTNLILAVNLNPTNTVSDSSNTPGAHDTIYRQTISAQGSKTFWLDDAGHHYRPLQDGGTSSAAPIITGAALLLQSYKPAFSPVLIKTCLLHSAHREFPIYGEDGVVKCGVYETTPSATWKQKDLPQEQYSFSKYGMGILNVKRALQYADVLETHLSLRESSEPITFEEFESLRKKLPVHSPRSSEDRVVDLES